MFSLSPETYLALFLSQFFAKTDLVADSIATVALRADIFRQSIGFWLIILWRANHVFVR